MSSSYPLIIFDRILKTYIIIPYGRPNSLSIQLNKYLLRCSLIWTRDYALGRHVLVEYNTIQKLQNQTCPENTTTRH